MNRLVLRLIVSLTGAVLVFSQFATGADSFPDDCGDTPEVASAIVPGGASSNLTIEVDADEDWLRFVALPGIAYRVDVTVSSIWDAVVELRAPDRALVMAVTNSGRSAAPVKATIAWTNVGSAGTYYLGISGYLRFTTGTCNMAVQRLNWVDSDGDGLPDSWETTKLGNLAWGANDDPDVDGAVNLNEYYAMTEPGDIASVLRVFAISNVANGVGLEWPCSAFAGYRIVRTDNLALGPWTSIGTNYHMTAGPAIKQWIDVSGGTQGMYRVEQVVGY